MIPVISKDVKQKAALGFWFSCRKTKRSMLLAEISQEGHDLIFKVVASNGTRQALFHVKRCFNGKAWGAPDSMPYEAGKEAGETAAHWFKSARKDVLPKPTADDCEIDPDLLEWMGE